MLWRLRPSSYTVRAETSASKKKKETKTEKKRKCATSLWDATSGKNRLNLVRCDPCRVQSGSMPLAAVTFVLVSENNTGGCNKKKHNLDGDKNGGEAFHSLAGVSGWALLGWVRSRSPPGYLSRPGRPCAACRRAETGRGPARSGVSSRSSSRAAWAWSPCSGRTLAETSGDVREQDGLRVPSCFHCSEGRAFSFKATSQLDWREQCLSTAGEQAPALTGIDPTARWESKDVLLCVSYSSFVITFQRVGGIESSFLFHEIN